MVDANDPWFAGDRGPRRSPRGPRKSRGS
jgi:hypothetical protein